MRRTALLVPAVLLLLAPLASAHCGSLPRPQDTRLLEDYVDECTSDGGHNDCKASDELIALDIQERWDGTRDVAAFRLMMDKGGAGSHRDTITLSSPKGQSSFVLQTSDDSHFTSGGGFDSVSNAQTLNDGPGSTRFVVEGVVALDKLGKVNDPLSNVNVAADQGDIMPGTCHNTIGDCPPALGAAADCYYNPTVAYTLRGSGWYATLTATDALSQHEGGEPVQITVQSQLEKAQQVTMTISAPPGVTARFHNPNSPAGQGYSDTLSFGLAAKAPYGVHLSFDGTPAGTQGTLTVTATTDAGGHSTVSVPYRVVVAGAASTSSTPPTTAASTSKSSPPIDLPLILLAALALAQARRRAAP